MLCYTVYSLLIAGLASQALAEPVREPYQPKLARMSTRNILGLQRRVLEGYAPMEQLCGDGDTCAEACGKGFKQCASKDKLTHCYNPLKKQTCCPGGSGDSCDNGYFCTSDEKKETWCCPDGLSLKECAQKYNIPGPLTSQAPPTPTTTSTSKLSTTTKASATKDHSTTETPDSTISTTKATTSTKSKKPESTESAESTTTKSKPKETSTTTSSVLTTTLLIDVSSAAPSTTEAAATQTTPLDSAPSSTLPAPASTTSVSENGSRSFGPTHSLMVFIVGALAALA
ncbi:hypothetical protein O1611_g6153 [Lasiodiplodia mahajangana]|uniref:Uncharacterized protein n=1 Tax=Lasiodiplodia mahajangana TaxID=1108764 RepID=A0ACC2JJS5_9PEZI|nr:hypothetical protein O1611_g6153 [Lasiodiplodia mahajangana]